MDFRDPPRQKPQENLLPMINVVFLLLIFFLISARLTPSEPFEVTPPQSQAEEEAQGDFTLYLSATAEIGFRDAVGDAAFAEVTVAKDAFCLASDCTQNVPVLTLRADSQLEARELAKLMPRLSALGFGKIELVTTGLVK